MNLYINWKNITKLAKAHFALDHDPNIKNRPRKCSRYEKKCITYIFSINESEILNFGSTFSCSMAYNFSNKICLHCMAEGNGYYLLGIIFHLIKRIEDHIYIGFIF